MTVAGNIPPPDECYWAYCADDNVWLVRGPGSDWFVEAEYVAFSVDELIGWMVVNEVNRMRIQRDRRDVTTVWWIIRARKKEG